MKNCNKCNQIKSPEEFHRRKTSSDGLDFYCKECKSKDKKLYYSRNKEKVSEANRKYRDFNKEAARKYHRKYRQSNKEKLKTLRKKYYEENRDKILSQQKKYFEKYKEHNRDKVRFWSTKRRVSKLQSIPSWLSKDQLKEIEDLYWLARDLETTSGEKYEVDHIIPLQGADICGLHVPWNLQILPRDINRKKSNKLYTEDLD